MDTQQHHHPGRRLLLLVVAVLVVMPLASAFVLPAPINNHKSIIPRSSAAAGARMGLGVVVSVGRLFEIRIRSGKDTNPTAHPTGRRAAGRVGRSVWGMPALFSSSSSSSASASASASSAEAERQQGQGQGQELSADEEMMEELIACPWDQLEEFSNKVCVDGWCVCYA